MNQDAEALPLIIEELEKCMKSIEGFQSVSSGCLPRVALRLRRWSQ